MPGNVLALAADQDHSLLSPTVEGSSGTGNDVDVVQRGASTSSRVTVIQSNVEDDEVLIVD